MLRRAAYQRGVFHSYQSPVPIIVVGNVIAGGAGKTPVVLALANHLTASSNHVVAIISRGYGAKITGNEPLIYDRQNLSLSTSNTALADEALYLANESGLRVYCHPKRRLAIEAAIADGATLCLCDDGLQHYALRRDIEIVVHPNRADPFGNGWVLPVGPLRELASRANKADYQLSRFGPNHGYQYDYESVGWTSIADDRKNYPTNAFQAQIVSSDKPVMLLAGIADPMQFFSTVSQLLKLPNCEKKTFADHYAYTESDIVKLLEKDCLILTTDKDAVKIKPILQNLSKKYPKYYSVELLASRFYRLSMRAILPNTLLETLSTRIDKLR